MSGERVFITGMGALTPYGLGVDAYWEGILSGKNGIRPITRFDASAYTCQVGGCLPEEFRIEDHIDAELVPRMGGVQAHAIITAQEALSHGGLRIEDVDTSRFGVIAGSGLGEVAVVDALYDVFSEGDQVESRPSRDARVLAFHLMLSGVSGWVAAHFDLKGPNDSLCLACASGNAAIAQAAQLIRAGHADRMLAGASDRFHEYTVIFFMNSKAIAKSTNPLATDVMRPFDVNRSGIVLSDGAAFLLLESESAARERGATIYGEILGSGQTCDAYSMVMPRPDGDPITEAIRACLEDSKLAPEDVEYVCAHGTGTRANDPTEVAALKRALGDHAYRIPVSSLKSYHGHALGASSALELIAGIQGSRAGIVPHTLHLQDPDPECDLDHVPSTNRAHRYSVFLNNSFGFGGQNVVIGVRAGDPQEGP